MFTQRVVQLFLALTLAASLIATGFLLSDPLHATLSRCPPSTCVAFASAGSPVPEVTDDESGVNYSTAVKDLLRVAYPSAEGYQAVSAQFEATGILQVYWPIAEMLACKGGRRVAVNTDEEIVLRYRVGNCRIIFEEESSRRFPESSAFISHLSLLL